MKDGVQTRSSQLEQIRNVYENPTYETLLPHTDFLAPFRKVIDSRDLIAGGISTTWNVVRCVRLRAHHLRLHFVVGYPRGG